MGVAVLPLIVVYQAPVEIAQYVVALVDGLSDRVYVTYQVAGALFVGRVGDAVFRDEQRLAVSLGQSGDEEGESFGVGLDADVGEVRAAPGGTVIARSHCNVCSAVGGPYTYPATRLSPLILS